MKPIEQERTKQNLVKNWLKAIGRIPIPPCYKCSQWRPKQVKCNSLSVDFDLDQDDFLIIIECHGDTDITRIPQHKAYKIEKIEIFEAFKPGEREKVMH